MALIFEDEVFEAQDYSQKGLPKAEYDNCTFIGCNFSGIDLSDFTFTECRFENCNCTNVQLKNTGLKEVEFAHCKMLGVIFNDCNPFLLEMNFEACQLNLASFFQLKLKNISFRNCQLEEADFSEADLTGAKFFQSNLHRAVFEQSILEKADFRGAENFSIHPEKNRMRGAKFNKEALDGLLQQYGLVID